MMAIGCDSKLPTFVAPLPTCSCNVASGIFWMARAYQVKERMNSSDSRVAPHLDLFHLVMYYL